jgi:hypothetical protein
LPLTKPNTVDRNTFEIFAAKMEEIKSIQEKYEELERLLSHKPTKRDQGVNTDMQF